MKNYITEHQSPYLDLRAEVTDILFEGKSDFQDIVVADSKEYGRMLMLDGVFHRTKMNLRIMKILHTFPFFCTLLLKMY